MAVTRSSAAKFQEAKGLVNRFGYEDGRRPFSELVAENPRDAEGWMRMFGTTESSLGFGIPGSSPTGDHAASKTVEGTDKKTEGLA